MALVLAKDLRDAVLNAAFKGELSYQLPSDSDIEEYFTNVINEIKNSSNKKDETSALEDDELDDFPEIPNNWRYVRLNDLVSLEIRRGKSPKYDENGKALAFAQKCNSKYNGIQLQLARHISNESLKRYTENDCMRDCDIVVNSTGGGTLGRVGLYREDNNILNVPVYPDSHVTIIRAKKIVNSFYLYLYIKTLSPYLESLGEGSTNQTELKPKVLKDLIIPLPPIEEQQRIVDRVDELMAKIDEHEKLENQLVQLKEQFPKDMRDSLLQAAMSGKLTCYEDGDTNIDTYIEDLVKNKEKNVKSKKWKKEFSVEHIDNSSFEYSLGNNWKWCYLGDICAIRGGKRVPVGRKLSEEPTSQKYIRVADMKNHSVISNTIKYLPDDLIEKLALYTISKNDLYITVAGTIGDVGVVPNELDGANLTENADKIIFENIDKQWLLTCLLSNVVQRQINEATTQVGQPKLAIKRIQSLSIPLCPLEEQKRIVEKLDKMLPLVDALAQMD